MHYFVTGATGFVGGYLTSLLLAEGHAVTTLVRSREQARALAPYGVKPHIGDVTDKESMRRGMRDADGVFHTAGWVRVGKRERRVAEAVNVEGTRNVLELMRELHTPRGVYTSTISVFSDTKGAVPDEGYRFEGRHLTLYDQTKWRALNEVARPMIRRGLPLVVVQPGLVYGPGDRGEMARVIRSYLLGRMPLFPTGDRLLWAYVEDVAVGHLLAMEKGRPGESYILGGSINTLIEAMGMAGRLIGRKRGPIPYPGVLLRPVAAVLTGMGYVVPRLRGPGEKLRAGARVSYLGDDAKARRELGYRGRTLDEGLPDVVRAILQDLFEPFE